LVVNGQWADESRVAKQFAVVAFLVDLCEFPGCTDPVLASVFSAIDDIATPGEAVTTGPLAFEELIAKFNGNPVYRYVCPSASISMNVDPHCKGNEVERHRILDTEC
jgi:hypothetical protein